MNIQELHFLLVEDHDFQRRILRRLLAGLGARHITEAADGHAALAALDSAPQPVDICIVDLNMPGMDGMELIRHLAEARSKVAVILSSALDRPLIASVETMARAYGIRLLGAMEKPATAQALQDLVALYGMHAQARRRPARTPLQEPSLDELRAALAAQQFEPWFQPKANLRSGEIHSAEALARWRHPERGMIPPNLFIPLMEQHGLIDELTAQMVARTAEAWRIWAAKGQHYKVSINLSLSSLALPGYAEGLIRVLEQHEVPPRHIVFEVTESAAMADLPHSLENLARLRMKGYGLSIDDYGTGYSSMQQLLRIPFSELKLDRAFVTGTSDDRAKALVLSSALALAHELKLESVAEGVESPADWHFLNRLNCQYAQGYLISKPVPAAEFCSAVTSWRTLYAEINQENAA